MEKQTNRSLAYLLAKTIHEDELDSISGGSKPVELGAQSCTATGDSARGPDMRFDTSFDL